jgi:hypothetical protein
MSFKGDVPMKRMMAVGTLLAAFGIGHAVAQSCGTAPTAGLTPVQIETLIGGQYACVGSSPTAQWNELHTGSASSSTGSMVDYKLGPTDKVDPSTTVGTYRISAGPLGGGQNPGLITYTYGSQAYGYYIVDNLSHPQYSFCGATGGVPQLAVTVSGSHC